MNHPTPPADDAVPPLARWWIAGCALVGLAAVLSCLPLGWLSDDWRLVARAPARWWAPDPQHLSLPLGLLWLIGAPVAHRLAALAAHLVSYLLLLPRIGVRLGLSPARARWTGVAALALSSCAEPLVWACTAGYALVTTCLLACVLAHLRWLETGERAARFGSLAALAVGLATWEFAAVGPLLVAGASWLAGRDARRALRDALPHALLWLPYLGVKLALGSAVVPAGRGALRLAGNVAFTPFLLLCPWLLDRHQLLSAPGVAAAALTLLALIALAWRARSRVCAGCLLLIYAPLLPVLRAAGPEQRTLYLAAPWAVLGLSAGLARLAPRARRAVGVGLLLGLALHAANLWRFAAGWRAADRVSRAVLDRLAAAGADGRPLVILNAPDRLPGWGPTHKYFVWRLGLPEALAARGVTVRAQGHTRDDPERLGVRVATPRVSADDPAWRGARVVDLAR